jgi:hypothetical protein
MSTVQQHVAAMSGEPAIRRIILVTTADAHSGREAAVAKLFASVERVRQQRPGVTIIHYFLVQRSPDRASAITQFAVPEHVAVTTDERQLPLSVARNRMLDTILAEQAMDGALVAFPDDDAWYPDGVLEHIHDQFAADARLDLWFCRYGSQASLPDSVTEQVPTLQNLLSFASSNTTVLRGELLRRIGGFDEHLGLGTPARSGEDTEFAMRAYLAARRTNFLPAQAVGHRDFSPEVRARYFAGSLVAIARHASRSGRGVMALARKLAVGLALTAKGELSPSGYAEALIMVCRRRQPPAGGERGPRPSQIRRFPFHGDVALAAEKP